MTKAPLSAVARLDYGFAFDSTRFNTDGRGLPLVRIRDVVRGRSDTFYSGEYADRYIVNNGDYLIGMDGQFNLARWQGGTALLNQRVCRVGELDGSLDRGYLARFLPLALKRIEGATPFVTVKHLSAKALNAIQVPLPSLAEQRRIAEILDRADAIRAKRRLVLAHLDALTKELYFAKFESKTWPTEPLLELAEAPDDIRCGPFGTQLSASEFKPSGVPLLGIKNVNAKFRVPPFEFLDQAKASELAQYDLQPGDLVMTRKGTIGNCATYPSSLPAGVMHSDLLRVRVQPSAVDIVFLEHHLQLSPRISHQIRMMSPGAVMPGINVTKLKQLDVDSPPLELQREFAAQVRKVESKREVVQRTLAADDELFASLQAQAFGGEL